MKPAVFLYALLGLYLLPLLAALSAVFVSHAFVYTQSTWSLSLALSLSSTTYAPMKHVLATIVVPLLTAYAVKKLPPNDAIPREAAVLGSIFLAVAFTGYILSASYSTLNSRGLTRVDGEAKDFQGVFQDAPLAFAKEGLTYFALVLGLRTAK